MTLDHIAEIAIIDISRMQRNVMELPKMSYRTKSFDPDYRKDPKTFFFCERCQRDLNADQPHRFIAYELDTDQAIHSEDWEIAVTEITARRAKYLDPVVIGPVGMDCAKRIGLEYTRENTNDRCEWYMPDDIAKEYD